MRSTLETVENNRSGNFLRVCESGATIRGMTFTGERDYPAKYAARYIKSRKSTLERQGYIKVSTWIKSEVKN